MFIKKAQKTRFWCIQIEKEHIEYLAIAGYKVQTVFHKKASCQDLREQRHIRQLPKERRQAPFNSRRKGKF